MLRLALAIVQAGTPPEAPAAPPPRDDVVVTGTRGIDDPASVVTRETLGGSRTGQGAARSRETFSRADRFARCAVAKAGFARDHLRAALDGVINSPAQRFGQQRFVQINAPCAQDPQLASWSGVATLSRDYDASYYDRGALFVQALRRYAPDLRLTKRQTGDRAVQQRFNARELPLARLRFTADLDYFRMAVCLVRLQPELSVQLVSTDDADAVSRTEAFIVNGARVCTGGARRVYFDPSQFRFYIADAVYRWAVAARGVDSLIPAEG